MELTYETSFFLLRNSAQGTTDKNLVQETEVREKKTDRGTNFMRDIWDTLLRFAVRIEFGIPATQDYQWQIKI